MVTHRATNRAGSVTVTSRAVVRPRKLILCGAALFIAGGTGLFLTDTRRCGVYVMNPTPAPPPDPLAWHACAGESEVSLRPDRTRLGRGARARRGHRTPDGRVPPRRDRRRSAVPPGG